MKTPGPDHPITLAANPRRVRARFQNHVIADTKLATTLTEADLPPVQYFPREDVETGFMSKSPTVTTCPYKGEANYYSMLMNGDLAQDAAWSYEAPYPAMEEIKGMIAFDPKMIEVYEVSEADLEDHRRPEAVADWPAPK